MSAGTVSLKLPDDLPSQPISNHQIAETTGIKRGTVDYWVSQMRHRENPSPWVWTTPSTTCNRACPVRHKVLALAERTPHGDMIWQDELEAIVVAEISCTPMAVHRAIKAIQEIGGWHWQLGRHHKKRGRYAEHDKDRV
jgi:hypothetical protein